MEMKMLKQFCGFTCSAVMNVLWIIRCNTWGQDNLVLVLHCFFKLAHLFCFVTCVLKIQDDISVTDSPSVKQGEEICFIIVAHKILTLRSVWKSYHGSYTSPPLLFPMWGLLAFFLDFWPMKMEPMGCPETSISKYHRSLRNNPEERSPRQIRSGSPPSRNIVSVLGFAN